VTRKDFGTPLTERERECLVHAANGLNAEQTAKEMYVALETVKQHRQAALRRLGVRNITHATAIAIRTNVIHKHEIEDKSRSKTLIFFDHKPVQEMTRDEAMAEWETLRERCAIIGNDVRSRRDPENPVLGVVKHQNSSLVDLWTKEQLLQRRNRRKMSKRMKLQAEFEKELSEIDDEDATLAKEFEELQGSP
jgi:DNA-binding CsgD family transcriptional regulator